MSPPAWVDAHCHLDSIGAGDEEAVSGAVSRARAASVGTMVTIGTDVASSRAAAAIAAAYGPVWAAVGVHPHDATTLDDAALEELEVLATDPKVVAIGEIGLDYFSPPDAPRDLPPRAAQMDAFRAQLTLARRLGKAVVIHMRDAHDDVFATLAEVGPPDRLIFHCFSGGPDDARRGLELGGYISFAGNISYKKADSLRAAAAVVPEDRLLVETDSPYLAPMPHRGKPNEPAFVPFVGLAVASAASIPIEDLAARTVENTARAFGIEVSPSGS